MRLHTLELTGFGPFRETQRVDFDAFADDGVFLISGRTGTGKSSILDGVSFALYGSVPRYDGGERRLRSDHCFLTDPTQVRLEFTVGGTRWRVTRAPEYDRPAKRGGGLTTEPTRAELEELVDGQWVGRAGKPREVGILLSEVLSLTAQQFQQVILLAQNQFSRFLLASGDERQTLLRTLFGTQRFERYRDALDERRRDAQRGLETAGEHARTLIDLAERLVDEQLPAGDAVDRPTELAARRDGLVAAQNRADYRVEQAATVQAQADSTHAAAVATHTALAERAQLGRERADARGRLADLEERGPEIAGLRERLVLARAAEALRAPLDAADRARRALEDATAVETDALAAWTAAGGAGDVEANSRADELTAELARWEAAAAAEASLPALAARLAEQAAAITAIDAELATCAARLAALPEGRAALEADTARARAGAARRDDLRARLAQLSAQEEAAREAATLDAEVTAAERAHLEASAALDGAATAVTTLLRRRLDGHAGELAEALVDGMPCAVCGSTAHPHPAPRTDPVTDDDLAAAERARSAAQSAASAAAETAHALRARRADAHARAGGQDGEALRAQLVAARTEADAADAAWSELQALRDRSVALEARAQADEAERAALAARRADAGEAHAATRAEISRADTVAAQARGAFASVAERVTAATAERERARTLADARATRAERARAEADAVADRDSRLAATTFTSADDARAALLSAADQSDADARATQHAADLAATRARLLELELAISGDDVSDDELAAAADTVASADASRTAAIAAQRDAANTADRLRTLIRDADDALATISELAAEAEAVTRLADTVAGRAPNTMKMDLETFVLAAELEEIVAAANLRLADMSSGRYTLHHSDARAARGRASGLGIDVLDAHTGRLRAPQSLSGGETFLASLALALGLGEVVTSRAGGIRLDTLFVDEGFGSLDPETLDLAMRTLDELRAGGRTVGVISHVEAMKEQLPAQLLVEAGPEGPSVIRQDLPAEVSA